MNEVKVVNIRNYRVEPGWTVVRIDRSSILGNPYFMNNETERNSVCDKYEQYAMRKMTTDEKWIAEILRIRIMAETTNVALACWCAPKRCHGEFIKRLVESNDPGELTQMMYEVKFLK